MEDLNKYHEFISFRRAIPEASINVRPAISSSPHPRSSSSGLYVLSGLAKFASASNKGCMKPNVISSEAEKSLNLGIASTPRSVSPQTETKTI